MNRREFVGAAIAAAGLGRIVVASDVTMPQWGSGEVFVLKYPAGNDAARKECSLFAAELADHYACRVMFMPDNFDVLTLTTEEAEQLVQKLVEVRPIA